MGARSCRWKTLPGLLGNGQGRAQRGRTKAGRNTRRPARSQSLTLPAVKGADVSGEVLCPLALWTRPSLCLNFTISDQGNQKGAFGSRGPASAQGSSVDVFDWHSSLRKVGRDTVALCPPRNLEAPSLSAFVKAVSCSSGESCQSNKRGSGKSHSLGSSKSTRPPVESWQVLSNPASLLTSYFT